MKKFTLIMMCLLMAIGYEAKAQEDYIPFVVEGKVWNVRNCLPFSNDYWIGKYYLEGDTLINDVTCMKLYGYNIYNDCKTKYECALYEKGKKVFCFQKGKKEEELLYDFGMQTEDKLKLRYGEELKLVNIERHDYRGISQRYYVLWNIDETAQMQYQIYGNADEVMGFWIEGVGTRKYPIDNYPGQYVGVGGNGNIRINNCIVNGDTLYSWNDNRQYEQALSKKYISGISTVKENTFLTEGKTWKFNIYFDVQMKPQVPDTWKVYKGTYRYELKGDTVINGKECKKLYRVFDDENSAKIIFWYTKPPMVGEWRYVAALYEDDSRVNVIFEDDVNVIIEDKEFVLYDNNWSVGSKVYMPTGFSLGTNWVNRIGFMQSHGQELKCAYLNNCAYDWVGNYHMSRVNYSTFVERVGCLDDPFYTPKSVGYAMKCYSCVDGGVELLPDMNQFYADNYKVIQEDQEVYNASGIGPHTIEIDGINYTVENYMDGGVSVAPLTSGKYKGDIYIPDSITYNGNRYAVKAIAACAMDSCDGITSIRLPESIFKIYYHAFRGCTGVKDWNLPDSLYYVYGGAFAGCNGEITINSYLSSTGVDNADYYKRYVHVGPVFKGASFSKMTFTPKAEVISSSILSQCDVRVIILIGEKTVLNSKAFYEQANLSEVYNYAVMPQPIDDQTFSVYNTLHVLSGSVELYKNAIGWRNFTIVGDLISGISTVKAGGEARPSGWYDLQGRRLTEPRKGVNIIRYNDGTARKVLK